MASDRATAEAAVERLIEEVGGWPHVTTGEHRFGGTEFLVGGREIGHVHAWGMLDIAYLRALRDRLIEEGHTGVHHLLAESGWTTFHLDGPEQYDRARWLLRLSYLYHVSVLAGMPEGAEAFVDVDVERELATLELSDGLRDAFYRRTPA